MFTKSQFVRQAQDYSTDFIALSASESGWSALARLLPCAIRRNSHAIVQREEDELHYYYLYDTATLSMRLLNIMEKVLAETSLKTILDLHESDQSLTVTEDGPLIQDAVVVRADQALGFVPRVGGPSQSAVSPPTLWGEPPAYNNALDNFLDANVLLGSGLIRGIQGDFRHYSTEVGVNSNDSEAFHEFIRERALIGRLVSKPLPSVIQYNRGSTGPGTAEDESEDNAVFDVAKSPYKLDFDDAPNLEFAVRSPDSVGEKHPTEEGPALDESAPPASSPLRFFNARMSDRVALTAQTYLIVQVATKAEQSDAGNAVSTAAIGDFIGELTIDVHAPGLRAKGPTTQTLQVPATGNSARLRFGFIAHKAGLQQVDVMAWNGSAQVAGLTLQIAVEAEAVVEGANEGVVDMDMREPEAGEYTLDVAIDPESRRYRFQLRSDQKDVWSPMYSEPLLSERQKTYEATIAGLNAQARNLYGLKREDQTVWLRGMGNLLFEQLVPDELKSLLLAHKSKIRVLNILSEADPTPWELLFLADPDTGEGDFLSATTSVARWRYGAAPTRLLRRVDKVLVLPIEAPAEAKSELQHLQGVLGGATTIGDLSSLNALLATGAFDLLHFAAHNVNVASAQAGGAYVPFGAQRWDLTFMGAVPQNKFKSRAPLVFMNACTTSGTTELYTELASWADRFLKCGSGAFIGTLWEVRDSSARQFSETFYLNLLQDKTLGEAMQAARASLREANPGDPTQLAYTLYGNPLARLQQP